MVSGLLIALVTSSYAAAQSFVSDPLVDKIVPYTAIPYQVDQHTADRGPQHGYNICNSTTEGQDSLCQTGYVNHLDDFCLFAPPEPNTAIGAAEGIAVSFCTKPGRGTRLIPEGTLKGVQLVQSPGYVQIAGIIDQTRLNIASGDFGGELNSGGQDGRGNPIGGLIYSNAFPSNGGNNDTFQQSRRWTLFIGNDAFCFKACDDTQPNAKALCEHIYDRIGCTYNAPNTAQEGIFERCSGDDMTPVGVYTSDDGQTLTWTQPPESLGPITSVPYTPTPAPTSDCVRYESQELYSQLNSVIAPGASDTLTASGSGATGTATSRNGGGGSSLTAGAAGATSTNENANVAAVYHALSAVSIIAAMSGVLFSVSFLA
ncbi:hypothetical protein K435DRAFT_874825 [Dendrothele bispora CBS 962.96]|uniref:Macrofage activating glycoprotein n=1 Tax=Dendrothele bispora (strain CBS 962.96) TaxID=1314807 RepID=A0A4V4HBN6_DENBC|nr:hypothetical protein K435DRAFT_874825 [Dendrothele bispora CBS 962.96]